jgi:hypothetical protein
VSSLVDLFCGAGGSINGMVDAGFDLIRDPLSPITTIDHHALVIPYRRGQAKRVTEPIHAMTTHQSAAIVQCPHCSAAPHTSCRTIGALGSHSARTHASRVWWAEHPDMPKPSPNPAPAAAVAAKRTGGPRIRGAATTGVAYRLRATQRAPSGGLWVAVAVSVAGRECELVGVELGAVDVSYGVPHESALRRAVEAQVSERAPSKTHSLG